MVKLLECKLFKAFSLLTEILAELAMENSVSPFLTLW